MEAARQPEGTFGVGDVVGETFSVYGRRAAALIGSAAAVFVVIGLASGLLENFGGLVFGVLFAIGVTIGLILVVIPGLVLLTYWSVGAPAIVVERIEVLDGFGRSWRLVRGRAWEVFLVLLVVFVIVLAIQFVFTAIANPIGNGDVATLIAAIISTAITAPIFAIAASVLFFELGGGARETGVEGPAPQG
jgi:hypothetical protein